MADNVHPMHSRVKGRCAWPLLVESYSCLHYAGMGRTLGRHFLRPWRKHRDKTLEAVAEEVGISRTQLGRIEKGQQPFNEELLTRLADIYDCDVPDLIMRDPSDPQNIWSLWDHAKPAQRRQITAVAETIIRTGTDD